MIIFLKLLIITPRMTPIIKDLLCYHRRNWEGGGLDVLSTLIFEISTPKCVYVNLHLNTHYSLCIEKHNSF
jgi:hypothetical protein